MAVKKDAVKDTAPLTWDFVKIDKSKIIINENNPKIPNEKGESILTILIKKFGVIFDGIINKDFTLIDGHSRLKKNPKGAGKYFQPSRQLSPEEFKELNALFDLGRAGNPDMFKIEHLLEEKVLDEYDLGGDKEKPKIKTENLTSFEKTHVLLSFPPELMVKVQKHLQEIISIKGVEYEQAAN